VASGATVASGTTVAPDATEASRDVGGREEEKSDADSFIRFNGGAGSGVAWSFCNGVLSDTGAVN
jgi:hypothetical protein